MTFLPPDDEAAVQALRQEWLLRRHAAMKLAVVELAEAAKEICAEQRAWRAAHAARRFGDVMNTVDHRLRYPDTLAGDHQYDHDHEERGL